VESKLLERFTNSFERVRFDAYNPMHMLAARDMLFEYKRDTDFRFFLEDAFESVPQMMLFKVAEKALCGDKRETL
jgi:hypothetical protein